jgi:hypothetical protein
MLSVSRPMTSTRLTAARWKERAASADITPVGGTFVASDACPARKEPEPLFNRRKSTDQVP